MARASYTGSRRPGFAKTLIGGVVSAVALAPAVMLMARPAQAGITLIGSPITAGGYTFTNFDFSPLTGTATGSNANGISNTGQVVGTTVDIMGVPTGTNFAGFPLTMTLTQLNTGAGTPNWPMRCSCST
jgi:hypothetical protein